MCEKHAGKAAPAETLPSPQIKRLGFMIGEGLIPEDFDRMGAVEIERCLRATREPAGVAIKRSMGRPDRSIDLEIMSRRISCDARARKMSYTARTRLTPPSRRGA
jgi:hypothetical protein